MISFRARFTGICAYVPDVEFEDPKRDPKRVIVLMLEARLPNDGRPKISQDSVIIRPHAPVIEFSPADLYGSRDIASDLRVSWFLERRKISFEIEPKNDAANKANAFKVIQRLKGTHSSSAARDFNWGVHVRDVFSGSESFKLKKHILEDKKSRGLIAAKILLEKYGEVSSFGLNEKTTFDMASTLDDGYNPGPLSEQVALEFQDVDSVTVLAEDMDGKAKAVSLKFDTSKVAKDKPVDILVGNLCCDNIMHRFDDKSAALQKGDEDFRWYYELFDDNTVSRIKSDLTGLGLPMPFPIYSEGGTGLKPVQCMRLSLHAV